jgi:hypothetical protein
MQSHTNIVDPDAVPCCAVLLCPVHTTPQVLLGPCDPDSLHPDLSWLQQQLQGPQPPRMVVLVNPCNPTGVCVLCGLCGCLFREEGHVLGAGFVLQQPQQPQQPGMCMLA